MDADLSPAHMLLAAVHYSSNADIDSLCTLASRYRSILRKDVLLRIILSFLPEAVPSSEYVGLVQAIEDGDIAEKTPELDGSAVEHLSADEAAKKVKKLRLLPLNREGDAEDLADKPTALFLLRRAEKVDEEAGLLDELPGLLEPFLDQAPSIRTLMVSAILPLLRRNFEYYPRDPIPYSLAAFQKLADRAAVDHLLSQTGVRDEDLGLVGRDLQGLIGPWLYNERRWTRRKTGADTGTGEEAPCPGWEQVLQWLMRQAAKSWRVAVGVVEQWDGPGEADLGGYGVMWLSDEEQEHLEQSYARAALACAYLIPEASAEALEGAFGIVRNIASRLDLHSSPPLQTAAAQLEPIPLRDIEAVVLAGSVKHLGNEHLNENNVLTRTEASSIKFLEGVILSAFILTKAGSPCSVRRAGELVLLQDEREQRAEAVKVLHAPSSSGSKNDDKFWMQFRNELLWLRDWGSEEMVKGVFGQLSREFLEAEILKALLMNTRYSLARSLYEDGSDKPISPKLLRDTVLAAAMHAYDNASNANRTRGGVKKCDDIMHAFPRTLEPGLAVTQRLEALLKATHTVGNFRLVLKQGEPFTPVVLRVHSDAISIIGKILEQNPKSYTQLQELLDLGVNMVEAGLTVRDKTADEEPRQRRLVERRITAMCIDAALAEDDFETAYSYVVNRVSAMGPQQSGSNADDYSWKAALQAGRYRRTARTVQPTHLGTNASVNADLRHLEQRLECLATALRTAPAPTLQEVLNAFRRAEEELDALAQAEAARDDAWDEAADHHSLATAMPGAFGQTPAKRSAPTKSERVKAGEDAPVSLFDLTRTAMSRATGGAGRNLTAALPLSMGMGALAGSTGSLPRSEDDDSAMSVKSGERPRRKRDQLRDAAVGTLAAGVGWMIGAPVPSDRDREA